MEFPKLAGASEVGSERFAEAEVIGRELADICRCQDSILDDVRATNGVPPALMQELQASVERARRLAMGAQQLARLASGTLRHNEEQLPLDSILRDLIASRKNALRAQGVVVREDIKPAEVIVDAGLLVALVDAGIDWCVLQGTSLTVKLEVPIWPQHAVLTLSAGEAIQVTGQGARGTVDTLSWHVLVETANTIGAKVKRTIDASGAQVRVEFPRTVTQLEGVTAIEVDVAARGSVSMKRQSSRQRRLLLITSDAKLRSGVEDVCVQMALKLDTCPTAAKATTFCELQLPDVLLYDERACDRAFEMLRADLLRQCPTLPVVELSARPNRFEMSGWDGDSVSAISSDDVRARLPSILMMEFGEEF